MAEIVYRGIDVSMYQGKINWDLVKADGIEFAIIRGGYGRYDGQYDTTFERNYRECKRLGIPVGVYWYSYARTVADAKQEAKVCLSLIEGKQFEFPIAYDIEEKDSLVNGSALCQAFCEELEAAGYYAAIYSFKNALENMSEEIRSRYDVFLSHVDVGKSSYSGSYGIWQYSWKGNVRGIVGEVDMDYAYKDYPAIIRAAGLNGFTEEPDTSTDTATETAHPPTAVPEKSTDKAILEEILTHVSSIDEKLKDETIQSD